MSPADGFPWGATGNLQSVPLGVLFGHDLTFIQNTKCAKQSNYLNLVKGMQTTRRALHKLRGSTETMAMMFRHTRTLVRRTVGRFFQSYDNFRLILLRSSPKCILDVSSGEFLFNCKHVQPFTVSGALFTVHGNYRNRRNPQRHDHLILLASSITYSLLHYLPCPTNVPPTQGCGSQASDGREV